MLQEASKHLEDCIIAYTSTIIKDNAYDKSHQLYIKVSFTHPIIEDINISSLL